MQPNFDSLFEITELVHDRMTLRVKSPELKRMTLRYQIINQFNQVIRKGSFMGDTIELNLYHIPDGKYQFNLSDGNSLEHHKGFDKVSY